jgi:hypothetical protein
MQMTAMPSLTAKSREAPRHVFFDTDSTQLLVDNGSSHHIFRDKSLFVEYHPYSEEEHSEQEIEGLTETSAPEGEGIAWIRLEDDNGNVYEIDLENSRYMPSSPMNLFSPQTFCQQRAREGDYFCHCDTKASGLLLEWSEEGVAYSKFIPLTGSNVGITHTAPGYNSFSSFLAKGFPGFSAGPNYV